MRVLITHELFPPDFAGGGEWHVLQTARFLRARGVEVSVLTTGDPNITAFDGIPTTRLPIHRYRLNLRAATIAEHARDATLVHTFNFHACVASQLAATRLGKPIVCGVLGVYGSVWTEMKGRVLGPLWSAWERFVLRRPFSRLIFLSEDSRRLAIDMGTPAARSVVIPTGIELERYAPAHVKTNEVLFVGKFDVRKGIDELIAAARHLPDVPFRVIGWGPREAALRAAAPPNVTVERLGQGMPPIEAFGRAAIFALPSHREGMSRAVLEAMASGCAIVTCVPGDYAGREVPPRDVPMLVDALRAFHADPASTTAMGHRNHAIARRYSWDAYADALMAVYDDVLGTAASGTRALSAAAR